MRDWCHVDIDTICDVHLRGMHVEMHMIIGTLQRKKRIDGFIRNNLFEPLTIYSRHDEIANEMINRGMNHISDLPECDMSYLPWLQLHHKVPVGFALKQLHDRCLQCRNKYAVKQAKTYTIKL